MYTAQVDIKQVGIKTKTSFSETLKTFTKKHGGTKFAGSASFKLLFLAYACLSIFLSCLFYIIWG